MITGTQFFRGGVVDDLSGGDKQLYKNSDKVQVFDHSTSRNLDLPDATKFAEGGVHFVVINESGNVLNIRDYGDNVLETLNAIGQAAIICLMDNSSQNGEWLIKIIGGGIGPS